jgi:L-ascorbate metabolism protein UlaG (beta-lactamase superfamily)
MKIKWLGHSSFLITAESGTKILTDPYKPDSSLTYGEIKETADVVTVSHEHFDHNNVRAVRGNPVVLRQSGEAKGIRFTAINAFHDDVHGRQRGGDTIFCFAVDGIKVCHMGDLGQIPDEQQAGEIGQVDVLLIPVGGYFTLEPDAAGRVVDKIKPGVVIPMHFKTAKSAKMPIADIEKFLQGRQNVTRSDSSEVELKPDTLPSATQIVVLKPAL